MIPSFSVLATPLDPAEEPPSGVDPLGTLTAAERLGDVLLPGFTVRVWRARLLTFTALAAEVCERVVRTMDGRGEIRLEARLALEWLVVTGLVVDQLERGEGGARTGQRLPGSSLARAAWAAKQPLTRSSFLKGQAVNGPVGVMTRLATDMGILDADGGPGPKAAELLLAWARDEHLEGILAEERGDRRPGAAWMADVVRAVIDVVSKGWWPGQGNRLWALLAAPLRLGGIGAGERRMLGALLDGSPTRRRTLELLCPALREYLGARSPGAAAPRGVAERAVLWGRLHGDARRDDVVDRQIAIATQAVEAYETGAAQLQEGFDAIRWGLVRRGGRASEAEVLMIPQVAATGTELVASMSRTVGLLDSGLERLRGDPVLSEVRFTEPLERLRCEVAASVSVPALAEVILSRHEKVQRLKGKGTWVDRSSGPRWLLMPGFGVSGDEPPLRREEYVHPFRIGNAYSILADLERVEYEDSDGEE